MFGEVKILLSMFRRIKLKFRICFLIYYEGKNLFGEVKIRFNVTENVLLPEQNSVEWT